MGPGKISGVSDLSVSLLSKTALGSPHTCPVYAVLKSCKGVRQEKKTKNNNNKEIKRKVTRTARKSDGKDIKTKWRRNCFQS